MPAPKINKKSLKSREIVGKFASYRLAANNKKFYGGSVTIYRVVSLADPEPYYLIRNKQKNDCRHYRDSSNIFKN